MNAIKEILSRIDRNILDLIFEIREVKTAYKYSLRNLEPPYEEKSGAFADFQEELLPSSEHLVCNFIFGDYLCIVHKYRDKYRITADDVLIRAFKLDELNDSEDIVEVGAL